MEISKEWSAFSVNELSRAIELLVLPEWLNDPQVMVAILKACDYRPVDVRHQLKTGEQLNNGPRLSWSSIARSK